MVNLEHISVALHFFGNATQNPLPPGGMPSGTPEQDKLYLHRRLGSWRVEIPLLIHKQHGAGVLASARHGRKNKQCSPCPPAYEGLGEQQKLVQFFYKPWAIFSSLIPGGLAGLRLETQARRSFIILFIEQVLSSPRIYWPPEA